MQGRAGMLRAVARMMTAKADDEATLRAQIDALRREGAAASEEIERLKRERALATSYEEATAIDDGIARQVWTTGHCEMAIAQLEAQLAAARAIAQAAA